MTTPSTFSTVISLNGEDYNCFCELDVSIEHYANRSEHFGTPCSEEMTEAEIDLTDFSAQCEGMEATDETVLRALRPLLEQQIDKNHFEIVEKAS